MENKGIETRINPFETEDLNRKSAKKKKNQNNS